MLLNIGMNCLLAGVCTECEMEYVIVGLKLKFFEKLIKLQYIIVTLTYTYNICIPFHILYIHLLTNNLLEYLKTLHAKSVSFSKIFELASPLMHNDAS